jgi:hypothetical protein
MERMAYFYYTFVYELYSPVSMLRDHLEIQKFSNVQVMYRCIDLREIVKR